MKKRKFINLTREVLKKLWTNHFNSECLFIWESITNGGVWKRPLSEITSFSEEKINLLPAEYVLSQNYPNPFNPTTTINFILPERSIVFLSFYNQLGEEVAVSLNSEKEAGSHIIEWNASNLPSGVYFYELKTEKYRAVKKLLYLK